MFIGGKTPLIHTQHDSLCKDILLRSPLSLTRSQTVDSRQLALPEMACSFLSVDESEG